MDEQTTDDELISGDEREPWPTSGAPALALTGLVIATLSLAGFGLLNGSAYVTPFLQGPPSTQRLVVAGLLGAAFGALAAALGFVALRRSQPEDPRWATHLAQSAMLVGGLAFVLRVAATVVAATKDADAGYFAPL